MPALNRSSTTSDWTIKVPEIHLLWLVDKHIEFGFIRERSKDSYCESGGPSADPELLVRILLIDSLYGISSESKLVEELHMQLEWRWSTDLTESAEPRNECPRVAHHSVWYRGERRMVRTRRGCFHEDAA